MLSWIIHVYIYMCICIYVYTSMNESVLFPPWIFRKTSPKSMTWPLAAAQNSVVAWVRDSHKLSTNSIMYHESWCILFLNSHWCYPVSGCFCDLIISCIILSSYHQLSKYNQIIRCSIASTQPGHATFPVLPGLRSGTVHQTQKQTMMPCRGASLRNSPNLLDSFANRS